MGILNVTPDSFADGGVRFDAATRGRGRLRDGRGRRRHHRRRRRVDAPRRRAAARGRGAAARAAGRRAAGGARCRFRSRSTPTRRGSPARRSRAAPPSSTTSAACSTTRSSAAVAAASGAALVLMHTRGRSAACTTLAVYDGRAAGRRAGARRGDRARASAPGVSREAIIVDPGLGFAKRAEHSTRRWRASTALAALDRPILSGPSRKSFLKAALGERPRRANGAAAAVAASVLLGAHIVRVHGVGDGRRRPRADRSGVGCSRSPPDDSSLRTRPLELTPSHRPACQRHAACQRTEVTDGHMDHDRPDDSTPRVTRRIRSRRKHPQRVSASRALSRTSPATLTGDEQSRRTRVNARTPPASIASRRTTPSKHVPGPAFTPSRSGTRFRRRPSCDKLPSG